MSANINVYYEMETKNESFIKMHKYLESIGVKNNKFMLMIYDKDLIGVDPYANDLSDDIKRKIMVECKKNIWYYLRNICRISGKDQFILNKHNCAQIFLYLKRISSWLATHRFSYKTETSICLCAYEHMVEDGFVDIFSNNVGNKNIVISKLTERYKSLKDLGFVFKAKNFIENIYTMIYLNEAEYINNLYEIYAQYLCGKRSNEKLVLIGESIINDNITRDNLKVIHGMERWHDSMYDSTEFTAKGYYINYSYLDLGYDEEWFEKQCIILNNDPDIIRREILIERKG